VLKEWLPSLKRRSIKSTKKGLADASTSTSLFLYGQNQMEQQFSFISGDGVEETPGRLCVCTWSELQETMRSASCEPRPQTEKNSHQWISPANTRTKDDVERLAPFICLDIDRAGWPLERLLDCLNAFDSILYTTTRSTEDHPRWRVILRTDREYSPSEYYIIRAVLNAILQDALDPVKKSPNDIFFMPARWDGAFNHFESIRGLGGTSETRCLQIDDAKETFHRFGLDSIEPEEKPIIQYSGPFGARLRPPLEPAISYSWRTKFHSLEEGGRFFRMMFATAKRHRLENWNLTAEELATAGLQISPVDSGGNVRTKKSALREANKAIEAALQNIKPLTPMEKMRARFARETNRTNKQ
jgi:hypothetical protein